MPTNQDFYFLPYNHGLTGLTGTVWYPTWTRGGPATWSQTFPSSTPDMSTTFAACIVVSPSTPPTGAISLGGGTKDLPPPPQMMSEELDDIEHFKAQFAEWQLLRSAGNSL